MRKTEHTITLTVPELWHLIGAMQDSIDSGSYCDPKEQYIARAERVMVKLKAALEEGAPDA